MTLFRAKHDKENPYVIVNKTILKEKQMSWKAKGIWLYAFSRPDDWTFRLCDLLKQSSDGKDSVTSGLHELEKYGYLKRNRFRNEDGRFAPDAEWTFFETPQKIEADEPKSDFPLLDSPSEKPKPDFPTLDNPTLLSNESSLCNEEQQPVQKRSERSIASPVAPSAVNAASPVVVSFEDLKIEESLRNKILKEYTPEQIAVAVRRCKNWVGRSSDSAGLLTCLKNAEKWKDAEKTNNTTTNYEKAGEYLNDPKFKRHYSLKIERFNSYVEFDHGAQQPICLNYNEYGFMDKLRRTVEMFMDKGLIKLCPA